MIQNKYYISRKKNDYYCVNVVSYKYPIVIHILKFYGLDNCNFYQDNLQKEQ